MDGWIEEEEKETKKSVVCLASGMVSSLHHVSEREEETREQEPALSPLPFPLLFSFFALALYFLRWIIRALIHCSPFLLFLLFSLFLYFSYLYTCLFVFVSVAMDLSC